MTGRMISRRTHAAIRGFSLLEALVAMAIAAMALGTLYRAVGQGSKNAAAVQERVEAALVARSVLAGGLYAEDFARQTAGQMGFWRWRLDVQADTAQWRANPNAHPLGGVAAPAVQPVARITVHVMRVEGSPDALSWTGWKPYRATP